MPTSRTTTPAHMSRTRTTTCISTMRHMKDTVTTCAASSCTLWRYVHVAFHSGKAIADFSLRLLGYVGLRRRHYLHASHPVLRLDGLRPHRIAVHRHPHRCERDSSRYRHRKGPHARLERKDIECAADDQRGIISLFEMHVLIY